MRRLNTYPAYLAFLWLCFSSPSLNANPEGGTVVSGSASFDQQGNSLTVTNTPGTIINWQDFSIQTEETTRFVQQSSDSAVLNRVVGQDPSQILGKLQSNGRVFIVNPNGIVFGAESVIDVSGLAASTLNLSNEDFLSQNLNFTGDGTNGSLSNEGAITTSEGGFVYLIASNVENHGVIKSPKGEVILAAGHSVQLVSSDNPDIRVTLTAPEGEALNVGEIITRGGKTSIYAGIINQQGKISADSAVADENGKIFFKATQRTTLTSSSVTTANGSDGGSVTIQTTQGLTEVSGVVTATGDSEQGGEILILGEHVGILDEAYVDASGQTGGGTILIGGDNKGNNPDVQNAKATYVGVNTQLHADAAEEGDGGKVIVWSDDATRAYGTITAKGGSVSGNGGFVETSGGYLDVAGLKLDVSATDGNGGTWLLDPYNIIITGTTTVDNSGIPNFTPTATNSNIFNGDINTQLNAGTSVVIDTTGGGGDVGDITVSAAISKTAGADATLTLNAHDDIFVNSTITSSTGALNIVLNADQDDSGVGSVFVTQAITTNNGSVKLYGTDLSITAAINAGTNDVFLNPSVIGTAISIGGSNAFDLTQADINNISSTFLYIGYDMATYYTSNIDLTSAVAVDFGAQNMQIYSTGNTTVGANSLAATGGTINFINNSGATGDFNTNAGAISADELYAQNFNNINIGAGGINTTNFVYFRSKDVNINGTITAGGDVKLLQYSLSPISLGGSAAYNLTQADLLNINATGKIIVGEFATTTTADIASVGTVDVGAENLQINASDGITVGANSFSASGGSITLVNSNAGADIITGAGNISSNTVTMTSQDWVSIGTGGVTSTAGNIYLSGTDVTIGGAVNSGTGYTFLFPYLAGTAISIGGSEVFDISQTDLNNISAAGIYIGYDGATRNASTVDIASASAIDAGATNLYLYGTGNITTGNNTFAATGGLLYLSTITGSNTITTGAGAISANTIYTNSTGKTTIGNGGMTVTNDAFLSAPDLDIVGTVDAGTGNIYLYPNTVGTAISIDGAETFNLTQGDLTNLNFGTLTIGRDATTTYASTASISSSASTTVGSGSATAIIRTLNDITFGANNFTATGANVSFISDGGNINFNAGILTAGTVNLNAATNVIDNNGIGVNNIVATNLNVSSGGNASLDYQITGTLNSTGVVGTADLRVFPAGSGSTTTTTTSSSTNEPLTTTIATIANTTNTLSTGTTSTSTMLSEATATDTSTDTATTSDTTTADGTTSETTTSNSEEETNKDSETTSTKSDEKQPQTLAKKLPVCK